MAKNLLMLFFLSSVCKKNVVILSCANATRFGKNGFGMAVLQVPTFFRLIRLYEKAHQKQ
jgi:hypothetical protein